MESITHDPCLPQIGWQGKHLCDGRLGAVKRSVETGHLGQLGVDLHGATNRGEIVRLMKRGQRDEILQCCKHLRIHADRLVVDRAAMHHAVPDAHNAIFR